MQIKIFTLPITDNGETLEELNRFLRSHKVLSVEHHFIPDGMNSAWSFCVKFLNHQSPAATKQYVKADYKNVLDETTFHKFSQLRAIRKQIAEKEAVPAYAVFTDAELAEIAKLDEMSITGLKSVKGIGENKAGRYGQTIIDKFTGNEDEKNR